MKRRRRGSNAIEFGLTLPVMIVAAGGVFDYGAYTYRQNTLVHAVRDAVRIGITGDPNLDEGDPLYPVDLANSRLKEVLAGMGIDCEDDSTQPSYNCAIDTRIVPADSGAFHLLQTTVSLDFDPPVGLTPVPDQVVVRYTMALTQEIEGQGEPFVCNP